MLLSDGSAICSSTSSSSRSQRYDARDEDGWQTPRPPPLRSGSVKKKVSTAQWTTTLTPHRASMSTPWPIHAVPNHAKNKVPLQRTPDSSPTLGEHKTDPAPQLTRTRSRAPSPQPLLYEAQSSHASRHGSLSRGPSAVSSSGWLASVRRGGLCHCVLGFWLVLRAVLGELCGDLLGGSNRLGQGAPS